jgi:hypothetical protein
MTKIIKNEIIIYFVFCVFGDFLDKYFVIECRNKNRITLVAETTSAVVGVITFAPS